MNIHWLRFNVNFFDEPKIQIIESNPQGDSFIRIWMRLLCLAMKSQRPGFIEVQDGIPYEIEGLATVTRTNAETLKAALKVFSKLKMIDVAEGSTIEILNFRSDQSIDYIEAQNEKARIRMIEYRKKSGLSSKKKASKTVTRNEPRTIDERTSDRIGEDIKGDERKGEENNKELALASPSPDVKELCDWLAVVYKGRLITDAAQGQMYGKKAKEAMADILKADGLEGAKAVWKYAMEHDKFWQDKIIFPRHYDSIREKARAFYERLNSIKNTPAPF
jgi:predicted phage replisome organizer